MNRRMKKEEWKKKEKNEVTGRGIRKEGKEWGKIKRNEKRMKRSP